MRDPKVCEAPTYRAWVPGRLAVIGVWFALLYGCGGGGGTTDPDPVLQGDPSAISDADPAPNQVVESAVPGTPVGLTLSLAPSGGGAGNFSLRDSAGGAFAIDATTGVVTLAAGVDFETSPTRSITVQVDVGQPPNRRQYVRAYAISILDSPAPSLQLTFPMAHARFGDAFISVAGVVSHPELSNVRVSASAGGASVQGTVSDGQFQISNVPVSGNGSFTVSVVASHAGGESTMQSRTLSREPELTNVARMVLDTARARVLMVDRYTAAVVASPLDGGPRSIVSGRHVGSGPAFAEPVALCLDPDGQTLYVADGTLKSLLRVDLLTGNRTTLAAIGSGLFSPKELDFDPVRHTLVVSDESRGIWSISASTGEVRLLSSSLSAGPFIYAFRGLVFDAPHDRILVTDGSSLFAVDPVSGAHLLVSDGTLDPIGRFFDGLGLGPQTDVAYAADEFTNGVMRIDLTTGAAETVTSSGLSLFNVPAVGSGLDLQYPGDIVVSPDNRLFLIEGEYADPLVEVKPNGDRVIVRTAALGTGVNFRGPAGIKYDAARNLLVVADNVADFITEIDPTTGNRAIVTGRSDGKGSIDFEPLDAAFDATGQYYYVDFETNTLYAVRAGESPRVVSDLATGSGPVLNNPNGLEIDAPQDKAYVIDGEVVLEIDLENGTRRVLASGFISLMGIAADLSTQSLFVAEGSGRIFNIDLSSGAQRVVSFGSGTVWTGDIAYDDATHSLLVVRENPARLDRVSATGVSVPVDSLAPACGPTLQVPRSVAVDSARQIAYVTDDAYDAVIAVELRTGCRQLIAK